MLKTAPVILLALFVATPAAPVAQSGAGGFDVKDVLARMKAAYLALNSYADTGTVVQDNGGFAEHAQFKTFYTKAPRNLFIEYRHLGSVYKSGFRIPGTYRLVFWMQNGELEKWDQTGLHESYPSDGGGQVNALKSTSYGSNGITILIPSLVYTKANLATPIQAMEEPTAAGYEAIGARRHLKVMGVERWRYPSGQITGVRPISIWIDAETYLIRKIVEDTGKGAAIGTVDRRTITFEPQVNPKLDPSVFNFKIPAK